MILRISLDRTRGKNGVGPNLTGVLRRAAGTFKGNKFGISTKAAGEKGFVWTEETLFDYLVNPKKLLWAFLDDKRGKEQDGLQVKEGRSAPRRHFLSRDL
ncbi:MAG: c-type cytochrome [Rhizobiaceae bacterium]